MSKSSDASTLVPRINACALYDTRGALLLHMRNLQLLAGADRISWAALYRGEFGRDLWQYELLRGWKIMDTIDPDPNAHALVLDDRIARFMGAAKDRGIPPVVEYALNTTGHNRVAWRGIHGPSARDDWHYELLSSRDGIQDRLFAIASVAKGCECWFTLSQNAGSPAFTEREAILLQRALDEVPRLHYCLMLERGLLPDARPLSPREQETLQLLLKSRTETQIADELRLSEATVHGYVVEIYRKLQVRSRNELMTLWLHPVPE